MIKRTTSVILAVLMICMTFSGAAFAAKSPTKGARKAAATAISSVWVDGNAKTGELTVHAKGRGIKGIVAQYKKISFKRTKDDFGHEYLAYDKDASGAWETIDFDGTSGTLKLDADGLYAVRVAGVGRNGRTTGFRAAPNVYMAEVEPEYTEGEKNFNVKANPPKEGVSGYQVMHAEDKNMIHEDVITVETTDKLDKTVEDLKSGKHYAAVRPFIQLISNENKKENEKYDVTKDLDKTVDTYFGIRSENKELNIK